jgi:hypothetical protein
MVKYTFAQLDQWTKKTQRRIDAVLKDATQSVVAVAQVTKAKGGRMPVDTGNLRNSLISSVAGGASGQGEESYIMAAAGMKGGDLATFTWTAEYAAAVNNGNRGRPGAHFVEGAVDQWPAIVRASIAKVKARVG